MQALAEDPPLTPGALLRRIAHIALAAPLEAEAADPEESGAGNGATDAQYLLPQSVSSDYPNGASDDSDDAEMDELEESGVTVESAR